MRVPACQGTLKAVTILLPISSPQCPPKPRRPNSIASFSRLLSMRGDNILFRGFDATGDLRLPLRAPIQDLLGCVTLRAQLAHAEGIVPLGQANSRFVAHQIAMVVGGKR